MTKKRQTAAETAGGVTAVVANPQVIMQRVGVTMQAQREEMAVAIKTYRIRQGLTQQELGERWGVSRYTIMRAETAKDIGWVTAYKVFNQLVDEQHKEALEAMVLKKMMGDGQ